MIQSRAPPRGADIQRWREDHLVIASPEGPKAHERAERLVGFAFRIAVLLLIAVGAPFVFGYRSEAPVWGPFTSRYLFGVLVPFAVVSIGALTAALAWDPMARALAATAGRLPRTLALVATWGAGIAAIAYAAFISDEHVSVLMALLAPAALALAWHATYRGATAFLALSPILLFGIALFGVELATGGARPLAVWGDSSTFATRFPREAPFTGPGGRLIPGLNTKMRAPEYPGGAAIITNADGFRNEAEFVIPGGYDELRVLSLGDSFSTGFCAHQEHFFGSLLEREIRAASDRVRFMNAEVSDPAYGLHYLQTHGMRYGPKLVIYGLSGNDIMQAEQFYGPDRLFRLTAEGRLEANPAFDPAVADAWTRFSDFTYPVAGDLSTEPSRASYLVLAKLVRFRLFAMLAGASRRAGGRPVPMSGFTGDYERADGRKRLVDGASNLAFFYRPGGPPVEAMYAAFFDVLPAMQKTAAAAGARFLLVLHPSRLQTQQQDWEIMKQRWRLAEEDFDLTLPNRRIARFCHDNGIALCDLRYDFIAEAGRGRNLYLPGGDTHYGREGHAVAAAGAARCVRALLPAMLGDGLIALNASTAPPSRKPRVPQGQCLRGPH